MSGLTDRWNSSDVLRFRSTGRAPPLRSGLCRSVLGRIARRRCLRLSTQVKGLSYATSVNNGEPQMAIRMVTHSWGNRFTYLLSAIFSDALEAETYDGVADLLRWGRGPGGSEKWHRLEVGTSVLQLRHGKLDDLAEKLRNVGKLDVPYWVCAFSVNQHAGICATPPPTDTTGYPIIPCACTRAKHFSGDFSEMNKFDDMMAYLKRYLCEKSIRELSYIRLQQVVTRLRKSTQQ